MTAALRLSGVSKHFGALKAVDGVDLVVRPGSRHALIGPNGAGKSTLFSLVTGAQAVSAGTIEVNGSDVTKQQESRRARGGLAQTMQHSSVFRTQSVHANLALAAQRHRGSPFSLVPRRQKAVRERVHELAERVGLGSRGQVTAGALSHGERRQLEVGLALACEPRLLLMDEPAAGMSPAESNRLIELVLALPAEVTVLLVEHDLELVFALATEVTVLHLGAVLLTGAPELVRSSDEVQRAYLGTHRREQLFTDAPAVTAAAQEG